MAGLGQSYLNVNGVTETINGLWGNGNIQGAGTLNLGAGDASSTFHGAVGSGAALTLVKIGAGTNTLAGTVDNGSLAVVCSNGVLVLAKDAPLVRAAANLTVSGGTVKLAGTGGDQIYGGSAGYGVAVNSGTLDLNARSESVDRLEGTGGTVLNSSNATTSVLSVGQTNGTYSYAGTIQNGAGTVALVKSGTGTLTLTGANTFTGGTTISNGTLSLSGANNRLATSGAVRFGGAAALLLNGFSQTAPTLTVADAVAGTLDGGGGTLPASVVNVGQGAGGATLFLTNAVVQAQTITGVGSGDKIDWAAGTLRNFSAATNLLVTNLTLNLLPTGNHSVSVDANRTATLACAMTNTGDFAKTGAGTVILTGASTYSGITRVSNGVLRVEGTIASETRVLSAGTLSGSGTIGNKVQIYGTVTPGTVGTVGTLTIGGDVFMGNDTLWKVDVQFATSDLIHLTSGAYTLSAPVYINLSGPGAVGGRWLILKQESGSLTCDVSNFVLDDVSYALEILGGELWLKKRTTMSLFEFR